MKKEAIQLLRRFFVTECDRPTVGNQLKKDFETVKQVLNERKNGKVGNPGGNQPGPSG